MEALLKAQQHTEPIARMEAQHARTDAAALRLGSTPVFDREAVPVRISAYRQRLAYLPDQAKRSTG